MKNGRNFHYETSLEMKVSASKPFYSLPLHKKFILAFHFQFLYKTQIIKTIHSIIAGMLAIAYTNALAIARF